MRGGVRRRVVRTMRMYLRAYLLVDEVRLEVDVRGDLPLHLAREGREEGGYHRERLGEARDRVRVALASVRRT